MTVIQLIQELRLCPDNYIVMFDVEQSMENGSLGEAETALPVDEVQIGTGTERGFVYLTEEPML